MSGGPVAGSDGGVVGVNVAKRLDGEQVGFLVPARCAAALVERARKGPPLVVDKAKEEVGRQLDGWQAKFYESLRKEGFRSAAFGPYRGLESAAPWMTCWASTNGDQIPRPRAALNSTRCSSATGIFVSDRILTGRVDVSYAYYKSIDLNAFQFAKELSQRSAGPSIDMRGGKRLTEQECRDDFLAGAAARLGPALAMAVFLNDAHVAPHRSGIFRAEDGELVAGDLGTLNGLYSEHGARRVRRLPLAKEPGIRIGRTTLRVHDATHPVAAEKPLTPPRAHATWAAGLGGLLILLLLM